VRGFIAFVLIFLVFWIKLRMEEQWMRSQFGDTYATYAHQTAALVPYVSDRYVTIHPHAPFVEAVQFLSAAARAAKHDPVG
jgi:hypothetical protein